MPPRTSPIVEPAMPAMLLMPSARPRWSDGKASVRIAAELAISIDAPSAWKMRITINQIAAAWPCIQVTESRIEKNVKTTKPRL